MTTTIVTGASRGIGKAIAEILLSDPKASIVAVARSEAELSQLASKYGEDRVGVVVGDLADESTSSSAVKLAVSKFGGINALILNAGVLDPVGTFENVSIEDWKRLFDINYFSIIQLIQHSLPELVKSHGRVVAVSSGASVKSYSGWSAYGGSKAALNHLILSLADEKKGQVSAISIAPGVVDTSMQKDIREKFGKNMTPQGHKRFMDLHANKELVAPEVPATVIAGLASQGWDDSINGQYLRYNDAVLQKYA